MSVLSPPWPTQQSPWYGHHTTTSFSALAAPVIPPLDPLDSPFPSPTDVFSSPFNALGSGRSPPQPSRQQSPVPAGPSAFGGVPPRNARSLDRETLIQILNFFSTLIPAKFGARQQIRLVIHGGAVMLLNAELAQLAAVTAATDGRAKQRTTTRDIDYIARSFSSEWAQRYGMFDANDRLKHCILETALQFGLGADWMNSDADVALPMATDPVTGAVYDPIHAASIQMGDALTVYTSPNGLLKLVSVTPLWTVALKMVRFNAADREDICILLRSGTLSRQLHWTPIRLEVWLLGTCWAMGYAGYDNSRIKQIRQRMAEVVEEANRWDPQAVADDGHGGVVPLRAAATGIYPGAGYGYGYGYMQTNPIYYRGGDPRMGSPVHSPRSHTFPPASGPSPFVLGSTPTPPPLKKKKQKKAHTTAITSWPSQWTDLPTEKQEQWDWNPESADRWDQDVRQTAAKEKKQWHLSSLIPFLKSSRSQPALRNPKKQQKYEDDDESEGDDVTSVDSDSDDEEDWRDRERRKWGKAPPPVAGVVPPGAAGSQHSVADFMSNGMGPVTAPAVMASGPGTGQQPVLPGWSFPAQMQQQFHSQSPQPWLQGPMSQSPPPWLYPPQQSMSPPPWAYPYAYQRSPAPQRPVPGPDMNQVTAGMNALGLSGV
ncbi:hypothetical protein MSAN_02047900 [Mycena sanguinolenta]|uniref:Uncharacterized protein n=1 Tax=Mycena sanguinolenta TaxID=230812 RepID=A0A8H7CLD1_9AGAR|nr:hypothetical protein MSAN_02047900 [Mycena sanguinolenta]